MFANRLFEKMGLGLTAIEHFHNYKREEHIDLKTVAFEHSNLEHSLLSKKFDTNIWSKLAKIIVENIFLKKSKVEINKLDYIQNVQVLQKHKKLNFKIKIEIGI